MEFSLISMLIIIAKKNLQIMNMLIIFLFNMKKCTGYSTGSDNFENVISGVFVFYYTYPKFQNNRFWDNEIIQPYPTLRVNPRKYNDRNGLYRKMDKE